MATSVGAHDEACHEEQRQCGDLGGSDLLAGLRAMWWRDPSMRRIHARPHRYGRKPFGSSSHTREAAPKTRESKKLAAQDFLALRQMCAAGLDANRARSGSFGFRSSLWHP